MRIEHTLYKEFKSDQEFEKFIDLCEHSGCYPWNIYTLKTNLNRQRRYPDLASGQPRYWSRWTYTEQDLHEVEQWLTWMALKYTVSLTKATLYIDELNNRVTRKEHANDEHRL